LNKGLNNNKQKYYLPEFQEKLPIFMKKWWLDAVCPNQWDVVCSFDKENNINGVLVYYYFKQFGIFSSIGMPPLTQFSGIWFDYPNNIVHLHQRYKHAKDIADELMDQLPKVDFYQQQFHFSWGDWQPFYWKGYRQNTRYTFFIANQPNIDLLWENLKGKVRTSIRKAQSLLKIEENVEISTLIRFQNMTFSKKNINSPLSNDLIQNMVKHSLNEKSCKSWKAIDKQGTIYGIVYIVYDETTVYLLFSNIDHTLPNLGAIYLLIWEAILFAMKTGRNFDFEGTMLQEVESVFRGFGAEMKPYFKVYKFKNGWMEALNFLTNQRFIKL
jgi:hypothetical protein